METAIAPANEPAAVKATPANVLVPYICGPMTSMRPYEEMVRVIFTRLAKECEAVFGHRGWVPYEHLTGVSPAEASRIVRDRIRDLTSVMLFLGIGHSCGAGAALEMADRYGVPVVLFQTVGSLISPQVLGHPAIRATITMAISLVLPDNTDRILRQMVQDGQIVPKGNIAIEEELRA